MDMKRFLLFIAVLLLPCFAASAQTEKYAITYSGWGRVESGVKMGIPLERGAYELNIHRWRKTRGEAVLDPEERQLTLRLPRKEISYTFLTDSYVHHSPDGWDYVEHFSLENGVSTCNVWICTHEDGTRQILVIYPTFVQGYKLGPAE